MSRGDKVILIFVLLMWIALIVGSGCRVIQPVVDFVFSPPANSDNDNDNLVDSGKESLFNAIKGSNWLVTFSILGMAAGVFALMNGSRIGIPAIVASGASLFMALAVARFATWMAVCGFIGAVAAVGVSILVKNRALKEVVGNVQNIKESAANGGNKEEIQKDISTALLKQTKSTRKLVGKIRAKFLPEK